jgi:hypothetical protein
MKSLRLLGALLLVLTLTAQTAFPQTYAITTRFANARACPRTSCRVMVSLPRGTEIVVIGTATGTRTAGSRVWLHFEHEGEDAYVHSTLAEPSEPAPESAALCPSPEARCTEMTCEEAYACLADGMARLDRDGDSVPCEDICRGG